MREVPLAVVRQGQQDVLEPDFDGQFIDVSPKLSEEPDKTVDVFFPYERYLALCPNFPFDCEVLAKQLMRDICVQLTQDLVCDVRRLSRTLRLEDILDPSPNMTMLRPLLERQIPPLV